MPRQIIQCIAHLLIRCTTIFLLIAIESLIKLKLNIFFKDKHYHYYFLILKLMHLNWIRQYTQKKMDTVVAKLSCV